MLRLEVCSACNYPTHLLYYSEDKGWANLYVNTLTAYNGLTVSGPTKIGPAEKTITFTALFPSDKDPITMMVRNVGGLINAEVESCTHIHASSVLLLQHCLESTILGV